MSSIYSLAQCLALATLANGVKTTQLSTAGQNHRRTEGVSYKKTPNVYYFSTVAEEPFPGLLLTEIALTSSGSKPGEIRNAHLPHLMRSISIVAGCLLAD
jgi:hypothetical protein